MPYLPACSTSCWGCCMHWSAMLLLVQRCRTAVCYQTIAIRAGATHTVIVPQLLHQPEAPIGTYCLHAKVLIATDSVDSLLLHAGRTDADEDVDKDADMQYSKEGKHAPPKYDLQQMTSV